MICLLKCVAPALWHQVMCCCSCLLEERTQWQKEQERLHSDIAELHSRLSQDRFFCYLVYLITNAVPMYL